jgi:hypothetical protein
MILSIELRRHLKLRRYRDRNLKVESSRAGVRDLRDVSVSYISCAAPF